VKNTRPEVIEMAPCADGTFVPVVEMEWDAKDGSWFLLSDRGYPYMIHAPRTLTIVQVDEKRWGIISDTGEVIDTTARERDLPRLEAQAAAAANPYAIRVWQWTGGRPSKSLADVKRSQRIAWNREPIRNPYQQG
jgi:hypothetical protein